MSVGMRRIKFRKLSFTDAGAGELHVRLFPRPDPVEFRRFVSAFLEMPPLVSGKPPFRETAEPFRFVIRAVILHVAADLAVRKGADPDAAAVRDRKMYVRMGRKVRLSVRSRRFREGFRRISRELRCRTETERAGGNGGIDLIIKDEFCHSITGSRIRISRGLKNRGIQTVFDMPRLTARRFSYTPLVYFGNRCCPGAQIP